MASFEDYFFAVWMFNPLNCLRLVNPKMRAFLFISTFLSFTSFPPENRQKIRTEKERLLFSVSHNFFVQDGFFGKKSRILGSLKRHRRRAAEVLEKLPNFIREKSPTEKSFKSQLEVFKKPVS